MNAIDFLNSVNSEDKIAEMFYCITLRGFESINFQGYVTSENLKFAKEWCGECTISEDGFLKFKKFQGDVCVEVTLTPKN